MFYLELLSIIGFTSLGYGLWLYDPRLTYVVCGSLLLIFSFVMESAILSSNNKPKDGG